MKNQLDMNNKEKLLETVKEACEKARKQMMKNRLEEGGCVKHEIKYALNNS